MGRYDRDCVFEFATEMKERRFIMANILLKYPFISMRDSTEATLLELAEVRISASYARNGKKRSY